MADESTTEQHSPEPWAIQILGGGHEKANYAFADSDGVVMGEVWETDILSKANARRIVACVNACAGIPQDKLEQCGAAYWPQEVDTLRAKLAEAESERDGARKALRRKLAADALAVVREASAMTGQPCINCGQASVEGLVQQIAQLEAEHDQRKAAAKETRNRLADSLAQRIHERAVLEIERDSLQAKLIEAETRYVVASGVAGNLRALVGQLTEALELLAAIAQTWTDRLDSCPDDGQIWSGHHLGYTGGQLRAALAALAAAQDASAAQAERQAQG